MLSLQKPDSGVEKKRHEDFVVWQCAVTLSGDVRVEFWDHDRFSDVSANYYTLVCLCISVQGSAQSGGPN